MQELIIIKSNLPKIKELLLEHDSDYFLGIVGYERSGKSNLAQAIAREYIKAKPHYHKHNPDGKITFGIENFAFDAEQLIEKVYSLPRGSPLIVDEGATTLFSMDVITKDGKDAQKLLTVMGERNLFVIICVPDFYLLSPYSRSHRIKTLLRVTRRGGFAAYNRHTIAKIDKNKRTGRTMYPAPTFKDTWKEVKGDLWESYQKLKSDYLRRRMVREDRIIGVTAVSKITGLSTSTIYKYCDNGDIPYMEVLGQKKFRESDIANLIIEKKRGLGK